LAALYDAPMETSVVKEVDHLTELHRSYVEASPFVLLATNGPDGLDCSPRGDVPGFVRVVDERTLLLPDRRGNNRLDTLRNIVVDGRVGLLFLVPGVDVTLRVNGTAELSTDEELCESLAVRGKPPTTVVVVATTAVYTQCPRALVRSRLWDAGRHRDPAELPSTGQIMAAITEGRFDGAAYDRVYPERLRQTLY
ncbi:MAG: pyridoxamine 5'-phosphate oxidase family protein, partial [Pseudonocardia sp.]|nr:pyridoxamine 5'-phosphate oxidase family protein [Pseudonocardia sp.]